MTEHRTRLRRSGLAVAALLCLLTTGCVFGGFGGVCTAIGYISTVRVELKGDVSDVVGVRLCDADDVCSVTESEFETSHEDEPLKVVTPNQVGGAPDDGPFLPGQSDQVSEASGHQAWPPTTTTARSAATMPSATKGSPTAGSPSTAPPTSSPTSTSTSTSPSTPASTSPSPEAVPQYFARHDGGRTWTIEMPFGVPDDVVISAFRADGSIVGELAAHLDWTRVGGSEECGGPLEAGPVTLALSP